MPDTHSAIFVDLLGFATLVDTYEGDLDEMASRRLPPLSHRYFLDPLFVGPAAPSPMERQYRAFHHHLHDVIERWPIPPESHVISFSDSAFIVVQEAGVAIGVAEALMRALLEATVPARMGIASGSFAYLEFGHISSKHSPTKLNAQFLGTAITRAYHAESCGLPGLRIFCHPTFPEIARRPYSRQPTRFELPASEVGNRLGVAHELNYLWGMRNFTPRLSAGELDLKNDAFAKCLLSLGQGTTGRVREQYVATVDAQTRMRAAYGGSPIAAGL